MPTPDFAAAYGYVTARLECELDPMLVYHSPAHTLDVLAAAERLAPMEGISEGDTLLLRTAALYHDMGYIEAHEHNEAIGARIAAETLPGFGYTAAQIGVIHELIMATQLPQQPANGLQAILCDADMDSLGRDDFFIKSHQVRLEWAHQGRMIPLRDWYEIQLDMLTTHQYFTAAARALRDAGKHHHIRQLRELLGE